MEELSERISSGHDRITTFQLTVTMGAYLHKIKSVNISACIGEEPMSPYPL